MKQNNSQGNEEALLIHALIAGYEASDDSGPQGQLERSCADITYGLMELDYYLPMTAGRSATIVYRLAFPMEENQLRNPSLREQFA